MIATAQLPLDLGHRPALGREDFLVAPCNATAVAWVDRWPDWPFGTLVLHGQAGSGKSHLAAVWRERSGAAALGPTLPPLDALADLVERSPALILDDADAAARSAGGATLLFHLLNLVRARGGHLLLTAEAPPSAWAEVLPDLESRLNAAMVVALDIPDEALLSGVAVKLFADRQLAVAPDALDALVARVERSFDGVRAAVAAIDAAALAGQRPVTAALVRTVLAGGTG